MMVFFQTWLEEIFIWETFSGMWESDFKDCLHENSICPKMSIKPISVVWSYHMVILKHYIVTPLHCFFFISIYQSMRFKNLSGGDYLTFE